MSDPTPTDRSVTLPLSPGERWTLHHVLLDRIERGSTATDPSSVDPSPLEVVRAFETLEDGETRFTIAQLEAVRTVLAEYHHSPRWGGRDRTRIEQLLYQVTDVLDQHRTALSAG